MCEFLKVIVKKIQNIDSIFNLFSVRQSIWLVFDRLNLIPDGERLFTMRNGISILLRNKTTDLYVLRSIFGEGEYASLPEICLNPKDVTEPIVVLDVGGNIGIFSLWISKLYPLKRLIVVEPDQDNLRVLKENLSRNQKYSNFPYIIIEKALSDSNEDIQFDASYSHGLKRLSYGGNIKVNAITLKELFRSNNLDRVDLCKIDIEGGEWRLLNEENKEYFQKIETVVMEYHYFDNNSTGLTHDDLKRYFVSLGFELKAETFDKNTGIIYFQQK